ncbi:MAG: rRNA maturation RNase YbeY [Opitutaceae bacterium]|nr:rRNA maturation RNase YbeY [Opitutaceae bacterium]
MPAREISIRNAHPRLRLDRRAIAAAIARLDAHADRFRGGCPPGELSIAFLTAPALAALHAGFLGDPAPTDVITFEGDPALGAAGEICVSADTAAAYAAAHGLDFSAELVLYLVHGWLHLAGYDDLRPQEKRLMRAAEKRALALLRAAGMKPGFRLRPARKPESAPSR